MPKRMKTFMRAQAFDFVLALVLSVALSYTVLSGFDSSLVLRANFALEILIIGILLLILCAGSWSRGMRTATSIAAAVYCVIVVGLSLVLSVPGAAPFADGTVNDVEGNFTIFVVVLLVVTLLVYMLSRSRVGVTALCLFAVFSCCVVQYLFRTWTNDEGGLIVFIVVLVSSVTFIIYRRYCIMSTKSDHHVRFVFGQACMLGLIISAVCVAIGSLVFVCVIAPQNFQTPVIKPFEYRIIPPIVEYTGTYDEFLVENPDVYTSLLNEKEDATKHNAKGGSTPDDKQEEASTNPLIRFLQSISIFNEDDWNEAFNPVMYERLKLGISIGLLLIIALIVFLIIRRITLRKRRLQKLEDKPLNERVQFLYDFFLSRFAMLKLGKPQTSTPLEYAFDSRKNLVPFTRGTNKVDFVEVTLIYQRAVYAKSEIMQEEYDRICCYYNAFFNNARRHVGTLKWLWKFWRI